MWEQGLESEGTSLPGTSRGHTDCLCRLSMPAWLWGGTSLYQGLWAAAATAQTSELMSGLDVLPGPVRASLLPRAREQVAASCAGR